LKLKWKTLIIVGITFVSVLTISLAIMQTSTMSGLLKIEHDESLQETERVLDALSRELSELRATTTDYAAWNDTYEFVQTGNVDYINENMIAETLANLRLNVVLFLNSSGQVVYGKAFDLQNMTELPFPQSLVQHLASNGFLLHHDSVTSTITGLILLPEGPVLVASNPVVTSLHEGPIQGTMITGRFLDTHEISHLYEWTHLPLTLQILGSSWVSSDFQAASSSLSKEQPLFAQPLNNENVAGYGLVDDVYGNPILILRITKTRDVYAQGLASMIYSAVALFSIGSAFCVVSVILLEKLVLSRLSRLSADVRNVGKSSNLAARMSTTGKDELSELGRDINSMLSRLEQTTKRFGALLETAREGIVAVDPNENITYANRAFANMVGYEPDELMGLNVLKMLDEEGVKKVTQETDSRKKGRTSRYELAFHRKDGGTRLAQLSASPLWDEDRSFAGSLSIIMDITEQKRLEHALSESNTRLQQVTDNMFDMVSLTDVSGVYKYVSPSVRKTLGYEPNDLVGKTIFDYIHPDDKPRVMEEVQKAIQTRASSRTEYRHRHAAGHYLWLDGAGNFIRDDKGEMVGAVLSSHDITERKTMEEELHKSEERFRGIAERSFDAIATVDLEGTITYASPSVGNVLGFPPAETTGKSFLEYFQPVQLSNATQLFSDLLQGKRVEGLQLDLQKKDGTMGTVEINASPIVTKGEVTGIHAVFRDITQRKKMEDALRESEEKVRNIFRSSPDAIVVTELDGTIVDCNDATISLAGVSTKEELLGKNSYELISKDSYERAMKAMERIFELRTVRNLEYNLVARDGHEFPAEVSVSLMLDVSGAPKYLVATIEDITERKKMQKALHESEEKTRSIIQSSPNAITVGDLNGTVLDCNQADIDMFGYSTKEEMIGKNGFDFVAAKDQERAAEVFKKIIDTGIVKNFQCNGVAKDGHEFPIEISTSLVRDASGEPLYFVGIIEDITERKRMENLLKQSEERFRGLAERSFDTIVTVDQEGRVTYVSPAVTRMLGYSPEEFVHKPFQEYIQVAEASKALEAFAQLAQGGNIKALQLEILRKDGSKAITDINASPILQNEEVAGFQATVRDITERQQMLAKLEEYSQQLEQMVDKRTRQLKETQEQLVKAERLAAIGQVAAMVGHDLRNPLTGIKGAAYYLKTKPNLRIDQKSLEMLELIERDVEYSNKIITDLMDYSREIRLELTETDPNSIMKEALSLLQIPSNVQIADTTQNQPKTKLDMQKIKRVFSNLIKNAVDAMPIGGKLSISSKPIDGSVEFSFVDTGTGIAKEVIEKIYTPFFTTKAKGMGLGLAICKRIVEAHGGKISVESIVGEGTTFSITIPTEPTQKPTEGGEQVWVNMPESLLSTTTKA
jgi:PAS domain S-box-containing protein